MARVATFTTRGASVFEVLDDLPADVIGVTAVGKVTAEDYESTLIPLLNDAVEQHEKVAALIVLGPDFEGYSPGGAVDDLRLGLGHATSFRRLAIVTDHDWLRRSVDVFMHVLPGKSRGFSVADLGEAREWIAEPD